MASPDKAHYPHPSCQACQMARQVGVPGCSAHAFTCPRCGMTSYNPDDVREGYCGNCHDLTRLYG